MIMIMIIGCPGYPSQLFNQVPQYPAETWTRPGNSFPDIPPDILLPVCWVSK